MSDQHSGPWLVILKRDERVGAWFQAVRAGECWHVSSDGAPTSGWPTARPALVVLRSPRTNPLGLLTPDWLATARVWCHFGDCESDHPGLHALRIRDGWLGRGNAPGTAHYLFEGQALPRVVVPFSSSSLKTEWDRVLARLGGAFTAAVRGNTALEFDLGDLHGPWERATHRYYVELVHLEFLKALLPAYLGMTGDAVEPSVVADLVRRLESLGFYNGPWAAVQAPLLEKLSDGQPASRQLLEALFQVPATA